MAYEKLFEHIYKVSFKHVSCSHSKSKHSNENYRLWFRYRIHWQRELFLCRNFAPYLLCGRIFILTQLDTILQIQDPSWIWRTISSPSQMKEIAWKHPVNRLPSVAEEKFSSVMASNAHSAASIPDFIAVWVPLIFGTFMNPGLQPARRPPGNASLGIH